MYALESQKEEATMSRRKKITRDPGAAAGYVRCSTREQATEGVTLAAQEERIRAYCTMKGLRLVEVVADPGVSGGDSFADRPGGARVLELVAVGAVAAVIVVKLDRAFRDTADCLVLTREWDRAGVGLHVVDLGGSALDTRSAMGRLFLTMLGGIAEMERGLIAERTAAALAHKRACLERVGAVRRGYKLAADGVHLEADPAEQRMIAVAKRLRAEGLS